MIGGLLRILVVALVVLVAAMMLMPRIGPSDARVEVATVLDAPRPLPAVALVDHRGEPFSPADLAGRPALVFFGFTNCPDVCPTTLAAIANALAILRAEDPGAAPSVLFVSVDPARDSVARIRAYVESFDPAFTGATADETTLAPLLQALGVSVHREHQGDASYNVVHNGTIYVLDSEARWAALFGGSSHRPAVIASDYRALRRSL